MEASELNRVHSFTLWRTHDRANKPPLKKYDPNVVGARNNLVIFRKRVAGLSPSTLERFILRARRLVRLRETVNLVVTGSAELRSLNRRFRGADKPTDVLSFPPPRLANESQKRLAGDVVISVDIARDNAKRLGHSVAEEVKILVLHGILHLAGYDHERDHGEMARKETRLRQQLKLETGLIERMQARTRRASVRQAGKKHSGADAGRAA